jgi:hypothetical protein
MVDAFFLVLDVFGLANRKGRPFGWIPFPWVSFQGDHNALAISISRFLVASRPVRDLLLCAKHLFVGARTVWCGLQ